MTDKRAVILLSGGLDSATVLAMAREQGYACYSMSFDYGQRHRAELQASVRVAEQLGVVEHKVVGLNLNGIGGSALTDQAIAVPEDGLAEGIPVTGGILISPLITPFAKADIPFTVWIGGEVQRIIEGTLDW